MFKLTYTTAYTSKDQKKADVANSYIGYGVPGTSTARYYTDAQEQGIPTNDSFTPTADTVAFVSVNGGAKLTVDNLNRTFDDVNRVLQAGGEVVTDNPYHRSRNYNTGERQLVNFLTSVGAFEHTTPHFSIWRL
ncbi:hypothetical protein [Pasteurella testudinis]|uniref:hypothetical protein n=1 Tax=Pasteurella testudinis TaxID=761 RepID=UPI0040593019